MANVVTSALSFFLMIAVVVAVLSGALGLAGDTAETQAQRARSAATGSLGSLAVVDAVATPDAGATNLDITLLNNGDASYARYARWQVSVRYTNGSGVEVFTSAPYSETLEDGKWTLEGVYRDANRAQADLIEPSVVNPDEYMVVRVRLGDSAVAGSRGWAVVSPEEGPALSVFFDA